MSTTKYNAYDLNVIKIRRGPTIKIIIKKDAGPYDCNSVKIIR